MMKNMDRIVAARVSGVQRGVSRSLLFSVLLLLLFLGHKISATAMVLLFSLTIPVYC